MAPGRWHALGVVARELRCDVTLVNGQCFGWTKTGDSEWRGVIGSKVLGLQQTATDTLFQIHHPKKPTSKCVRDTEAVLRDYFQVDTHNLHDLYTHWNQACPRMTQITPHIAGLRLLRQDPIECLFSFLCSSNNHISRITKMLGSLRSSYGRKLCTLDGVDYYTFPSLTALTAIKEQDLRDLGFGYRAKFIVQSAAQIKSFGGVKWLHGLRQKEHSEVQTELCRLMGVGRKVADCVALFSLDKLEVTPVDTHVWQIAVRDFGFGTSVSKSLSKTTYHAIDDFFRARLGPQAGWAHSVLFTADLPAFQHFLPEKLRVASKSPKKKAKKRTAIEADSGEKPRVKAASKRKKR